MHLPGEKQYTKKFIVWFKGEIYLFSDCMSVYSLKTKSYIF